MIIFVKHFKKEDPKCMFLHVLLTYTTLLLFVFAILLQNMIPFCKYLPFAKWGLRVSMEFMRHWSKSGTLLLHIVT